MGSYEILDFLLGEVVPVPIVLGVANLVQVLLEDGEIGLGEADAQDDRMVGSGLRVLDPPTGDVDGLLYMEASPSGVGEGEGVEGGGEGYNQETHGETHGGLVAAWDDYILTAHLRYIGIRHDATMCDALASTPRPCAFLIPA